MIRGFARTILALTTALTLVIVHDASGQRVRRSQRGTVSQTINRTIITIEYNRPVARGRTLFGPTVRFGQPWTPGADEATTIEFSDDVLIDGHELPAGKYTMWAVPANRGPWEWIFSSAIDVWHLPYPGADRDQLRIELDPTHGSHMEVLAFYFPEVGTDRATLNFHWGTTVVQIPIRLKQDHE